MKITILDQHLDGNDPVGFNADAWLAALEAEYRATAAAHFPAAEIVVEIDRQRKCSGYSRPVTVDFDGEDDDPSFADLDALQTSIEYTCNDLYDARGQEFFDAIAPVL